MFNVYFLITQNLQYLNKQYLIHEARLNLMSHLL